MKTVNCFDNVKASAAPIDRNNDTRLMVLIITVLVLGLLCSRAFSGIIVPPPAIANGGLLDQSSFANDSLNPTVLLLQDIPLLGNDPQYFTLRNNAFDADNSASDFYRTLSDRMQSVTATFPAGQLDLMNNYASGPFAFGFAPNDHYGHTTGRFTLVRPPVPEPATLILLLLSSSVFFLHRKHTKFVPC